MLAKRTCSACDQHTFQTAVSHRGFAREWIVREEMIKSDYAYTYMLQYVDLTTN